MFESTIVKPFRKVRCPKCRAVDLIFTETVEHTTLFIQTAEGIDRDGVHNPGPVTRLDASCEDCGHYWKVRNATQITNICD